MELQPIQNKIYEIRGYRVMLDFDLAYAYGIETRVLKQAVRRNFKRFNGEDFMFEVTRDELSRSQYVTLNRISVTRISKKDILKDSTKCLIKYYIDCQQFYN